MPPIRSSAFPAAVLIMLLASACQDAPLGPHTPSSGPLRVAPIQGVRVQTFSGRRADSVMDALEMAWGQLGHPEFGRSRHQWRQQNGVPSRIGDAQSRQLVPTLPNAATLDEEGNSYERPAPKIISHYEVIHFGQVDQYVNVPAGIEAEMTFIGDAGDIQVGSMAISRGGGDMPYPVTGRIVAGPGELVNCQDVILGDCQNRRHLAGVMILYGVPQCDAKANGNVTYYVNNLNMPIGISFAPTPFSISTPGNMEGGVSANAEINSTAAPCSSGDDGGDHSQPTDTVPTVYTPGTGVEPLPRPTGWGVPTFPPPGTPSAPPEDFWCERVDLFLVGVTRTLLDSSYECYRSL
jgi:hypothetical protein